METKQVNLRLKLKSEFKNYIGDGLKIYYSHSRPIVEVIRYIENCKECKGGWVWEGDPHFLITYSELPKDILKDYELKEFDFNLMYFDGRWLRIDFNNLFDVCEIDLNDFLKSLNVEIKHLTPLYKEWFNVDDLINITKKVISEYYKGGV